MANVELRTHQPTPTKPWGPTKDFTSMSPWADLETRPQTLNAVK